MVADVHLAARLGGAGDDGKLHRREAGRAKKTPRRAKAGGGQGWSSSWGSGQPLAAAVIPLVDRAASKGADRAADDRADGLVAAARDFMAGKTACHRADDRAAGAIVALAIVP